MKAIPQGVSKSIVGALVLAGFSTFGDWLWTNYIPDGAIVPGVVHGALIFLILAGFLSWSLGTARAARRLVPTLPIVGLLLAAVFYPLAWMTGYLVALLITWALMWIALAVLERWARDGVDPVAQTLLRGLAAAVGSGLAFWAISGIWTQPVPDGPNYLWHFGCWAFAFLPGFLALLVRSPSGSA